MEKCLKRQRRVVGTQQGISFYEPTYILPYYWTGQPYQRPYKREILNQEFKGKMSFQMPLWSNILGSPLSLNISYTQLSYWQVYAEYPFFRETNYEPQLFLTVPLTSNVLAAIGINHKSNGLGGDPGDKSDKGDNTSWERSWNRLF